MIQPQAKNAWGVLPCAEHGTNLAGARYSLFCVYPFSAVMLWTFEEKIGNGWKKLLWYSGKMAFIFSVSIEMLQLLLRLGTFQLSDIFYNTVGGVISGVCYWGIMKMRKHL